MISFSIIIPNYNHGKFLHQRINSILCQTYQNFELIILDDASTDNSLEIIENFKDHPGISHIIYNKTNSGSPFKQWVQGIILAKNNWIWIAESDDYADEKFLETAQQYISLNPDTGIYYCDAFVSEKELPATKKWSDRKNKYFATSKWSTSYSRRGIEEINENLKYFCSINNSSSVVFNRDLANPFIHELNDYTYYGDWYFFLRLSAISNLQYCNLPLNFHVQHVRSFTYSPAFSIKKKCEHFSILKFLYYHPEVTEKEKLIYHFCAYFLSFGLLKDGVFSIPKLFATYFRLDFKLALKVLLSILQVKVTNRKYKQWED
jgi:glycosyltransferase involved in cell wall biosynthesis